MDSRKSIESGIELHLDGLNQVIKERGKVRRDCRVSLKNEEAFIMCCRTRLSLKKKSSFALLIFLFRKHYQIKIWPFKKDKDKNPKSLICNLEI